MLNYHLTATYPYIRAENSSTGCTSIHRLFCTCKCFDIAVFCFFNQSGQLWIKENKIWIFLLVSVLNFRSELWFIYLTTTLLYACEAKSRSLNFTSVGKVYFSSHCNKPTSRPLPAFGYCGAWIWVSIKPGITNCLRGEMHDYNMNMFKVLTLNLLNFQNGLVYLPFLELSIVNFGEIMIRIWSWPGNSVQYNCSYRPIALHWWQKLITFGCGMVRVKLNLVYNYKRSERGWYWITCSSPVWVRISNAWTFM